MKRAARARARVRSSSMDDAYDAHDDDDDTMTYAFDLDGTLYPISNGYEDACRARVFEFMTRACAGVRDVAHAREIWRRGFEKYNQTLRTLRAAGYETFEDEEYWAQTRGDARTHLTPNAETRAFVAGLRGRKYGACACACVRACACVCVW